MNFTFAPIGTISSCYKEKFGIPRQAGLVPEARAFLEVAPPYNRPEAFQGLEAFSHVWLLFVFHQNLRDTWKATVRPPRLGGNERRGVFSTRSPFRPNSLGLSAVELEGLEVDNSRVVLHLKGIDLLDGTPILDIKPYLPYADRISAATAEFATEAPNMGLEVAFTEQSRTAVLTLEKAGYPYLQRLIVDSLRSDPRPAYCKEQPERIFGFKILDFDVRWKIDKGRVLVTELIKQDPV